jgi:hypothetical protein
MLSNIDCNRDWILHTILLALVERSGQNWCAKDGTNIVDQCLNERGENVQLLAWFL